MLSVLGTKLKVYLTESQRLVTNFQKFNFNNINDFKAHRYYGGLFF